VDEDYREKAPFPAGGSSQPQWQIQKALRPTESDEVCTFSLHSRTLGSSSMEDNRGTSGPGDDAEALLHITGASWGCMGSSSWGQAPDNSVITGGESSPPPPDSSGPLVDSISKRSEPATDVYHIFPNVDECVGLIEAALSQSEVKG
jgi:hypothetical protein